MRYTFMLYNNEEEFKDVTEEQMGQIQVVYGQYIEALKEAGVFVDTDWLQPSMTATCISLKSGTKQVQDGPFVDSKEQLGGYFVVDVPDLDAALAWAEKCPSAHTGTIEVRPTAFGG